MILVTGATGHIGNVLARELVSQGEQVRALLMPGEDCLPLQGLDVELIEADILDYPALLQAFQGIDSAYHLAGMISIMPGKDRMVELVNVTGTRNVIHACRSCGVRRLVYTSSIHALKRTPQGILIDENIPFDPSTAAGAYEQSKARASLEVLEATSAGLDAVIACPTGVIGPFDYRDSEMGHIIRSCLQQKPQLYIDGVYDFVDVRDVVSGLILLNKMGRRGEAYILSGEQLSVRGLFDQVLQLTRKRFLRLKVPLALARLVAKAPPYIYHLTRIKPRLTTVVLETLASNSTISHAKAHRELGYSPRPLAESISDTIRWWTEGAERLKPALSPAV